ERGYTAAEQAVQQTFALGGEPLFTGQQRRVQMTAAVFLGPHRAFFDEAAQQGFDRRFRPVPIVRQGGNDRFGGQRTGAPQHGQNDGFRLADGHWRFHGRGRPQV